MTIVRRAPLTLRSTLTLLALLLLVLGAAIVLGLSVGSVDVRVADVAAALFTPSHTDDASRTIVLALRLPRVLLAAVVGAGLSIAGVVFQALLRNPLAEPYILGISSGGTVGAIIAISVGAGFSVWGTPLASFAGSLLVTVLVYTLAHRRGQLDTNTLLLAGVMVGAFFNAVVLLIVALFHQELRNAFLWLMGSFGSATMTALLVVAPLVVLASGVLIIQAKKYNLIATGEETAVQLGVDVRRLKRLTYALGSLITGLVVSVSGVIGFVGLIIPHMCRMLFGPDHRALLPAALVSGAAFMIVADVLARTVLAPMEIPVGAVTATIGAPLFVYLLKRTE
ncbi:MAG: iron ABC transporter [Ignavibacteria bacterium]